MLGLERAFEMQGTHIPGRALCDKVGGKLRISLDDDLHLRLGRVRLQSP
jgi:hypothetical protein